MGVKQCSYCLEKNGSVAIRKVHGVELSEYCSDCFQPDTYFYSAIDQQLHLDREVEAAAAAEESLDAYYEQQNNLIAEDDAIEIDLIEAAFDRLP